MDNGMDRRRWAGRGGFTLVEVMLVVAILGILATVVIGSFGGKQKQAQINAARAGIASLSTAVDLYEVDTGRYPPNLSALVNSDGSPNWNGPYVKSLKDPWGQDFQFTAVSDRSYKIISGGPDRSIGGSDDISSF